MEISTMTECVVGGGDDAIVRLLSNKFGFDYDVAIDFIRNGEKGCEGDAVVVEGNGSVVVEGNGSVVVEGAIDREQRDALFEVVSAKIKQDITPERIATYKTTRGDTQNAERDVINDIRKILDADGITYVEAGSQQSKDFRNVGGIGLDIEIKKTDGNVIYFNDTCPNKDIYYVIFMTGKKTKGYVIPSQVVCINGDEMVKGSAWVHDYQRELDELKNKYARGDNKKKLDGIMSVYPRPTYKADIGEFLTKIVVEKPVKPVKQAKVKQVKQVKQMKKKQSNVLSKVLTE